MSATPGPWGFNKYGGIGAGRFNLSPYVMSGDAIMGAYAFGDKGDLSYEENAANARLIATAPELLASLKEMRELCAAAFRVIANATADKADIQDDLVDQCKAIGLVDGVGIRAQAAIAKAEGTA